MRRIVFAMAALAVGLWTAPASAFFIGAGTGAAASTVASVPAPTGVSAVQSGEGTVHIAWSEASTPLSLTFRVQRTSAGGTATACTTTTRSCDDIAVAAGTYSYDVVATYSTWSTTSRSAASVTVIDHSPVVSSFTRLDAATTNQTTVSWRLVFSEPVSGLGPSNFTATTSGLTGASVGSVTGSGTSWQVTGSTGSGSGTLALTLSSSTGVTDSTGNPVAVPVTSETYTIRPFFPTSFVLANGGTNNRIDAGDTITISFSTAVDESSLCAMWTTGDQTSTAATVTVLDGGVANDSIAIALPTCPTLHLGSIALGAPGYVSGGTGVFTASLAFTSSTHTVVLTLGTRSGSGSIGVVGGAGSQPATFTPDPALLAASGVTAVGTSTSTGRF